MDIMDLILTRWLYAKECRHSKILEGTSYVHCDVRSLYKQEILSPCDLDFIGILQISKLEEVEEDEKDSRYKRSRHPPVSGFLLTFPLFFLTCSSFPSSCHVLHSSRPSSNSICVLETKFKLNSPFVTWYGTCNERSWFYNRFGDFQT